MNGRCATVCTMPTHTPDKLSPQTLMADALGDGDGHAIDSPSLQLRARYSVRPTLDGRQMVERITA